MPNYLVTGVLGAGKSLVAVSRIREYLWQGRKVATNLDLFPEHLDQGDRYRESNIIRIPDKPRVCDLVAIGRGHDGDKPDDSKNGILVLDELATWLNSRDWRDKERAGVIDWMLHARKNRWDVYLLVQDAGAIDGQLRESLCDHFVRCSRFDRIKVMGIKPPRLHLAHIFYGKSESGISVGRWTYRGTDLFQAYDTEQTFVMDEMYVDWQEAPIDMRASYSLLTPWHLKGRYLPPPVKKRSTLDNLKLLFTYGICLPAHFIYRLCVGAEKYNREMAFSACKRTDSV